MKTTDIFATWTCEKCGNTYRSSIEHCPNDGYSLQEGIKTTLFEQLKEVKITRIEQEFPNRFHYQPHEEGIDNAPNRLHYQPHEEGIDNAHAPNRLHYQPHEEGIVTIHYIKSKNA